MAFENERGINSGLFFGSEKESQLCRLLLEPYNESAYDAKKTQVNSAVNRPIFLSFFPELKWNAKTQIIDTNYIMGCDEYGLLMKHYGTRSWCDNLPDYTVSGDMRLKHVLRNPKIFEKLESNKIGRRIFPVYTFLSYDMLDLGPIFYLKRIYLKIRNKNEHH